MLRKKLRMGWSQTDWDGEISKRKGQQNFATVIGDIKVGKFIEMIDSQQQEDIIQALEQQPLAVRAQVEEQKC